MSPYRSAPIQKIESNKKEVFCGECRDFYCVGSCKSPSRPKEKNYRDQRSNKHVFPDEQNRNNDCPWFRAKWKPNLNTSIHKECLLTLLALSIWFFIVFYLSLLF